MITFIKREQGLKFEREEAFRFFLTTMTKTFKIMNMQGQRMYDL